MKHFTFRFLFGFSLLLSTNALAADQAYTCSQGLCEYSLSSFTDVACVKMVCTADSPEVIRVKLTINDKLFEKAKTCDKTPPKCTAIFQDKLLWHTAEEFIGDNPLKCELDTYIDAVTPGGYELNASSLDAALVSVSVSTNTGKVKAGQEEVSVSCPDNKKLLGLYCTTESSGASFRPSGYDKKLIGNTGTCVVRYDEQSDNLNNESDLTAKAFCGAFGVPSNHQEIFSNREIVTNSGNVNVGQPSVSVSCKGQNKTLIGGTCGITNSTGAFNATGYDQEILGNKFTCVARHDKNSSGTKTSKLTATAFCAVKTVTITSGSVIAHTSEVVNSFKINAGNQIHRISCPAGTQVLGGGCSLNTTDGGSFIPSGYEQKVSGSDFICSVKNDEGSSNANIQSDLTIKAICGVKKYVEGSAQCLFEPLEVRIADPLQSVNGDTCTMSVCDYSGNCSTCVSSEILIDEGKCKDLDGNNKFADGICGETTCAVGDNECLCITGQDPTACAVSTTVNCFNNPLHDWCKSNSFICQTNPTYPGCKAVNPCLPVTQPNKNCPADHIAFCQRNNNDISCTCDIPTCNTNQRMQCVNDGTTCGACSCIDL